MGDERGDIRAGDEKIKGEVRGMENGGGRKEEHTDKAEVWTDVSVYYSRRYGAFIKN